MATKLAIDPVLLDRAVRVSGAKSKTAAVTQALIEFTARREQARLVEASPAPKRATRSCGASRRCR